MSAQVWIALAVIVVLIAVVGIFVARKNSTHKQQPRPGIDYAPGVGDDDSIPRDTPRQTIDQIVISDALNVVPDLVVETQAPANEEAVLGFEIPDSAVGRMHRLRARLARSNNAIGKGLLGLLGRDNLDADTWDEIEETLLAADLGVAPTMELLETLRTAVQVEGHPSQERLTELLRTSLLELVNPNLDRTLNTKVEGRPAVVLVVGVNGTGKTTTTGKLARLLIAEDQTVLLAAADTFRAAAAEQLQTWGDLVGAPVVRGPEGGDPAAVAFDAVTTAIEAELDTAVIDTAGRLHTKTGLMDELGKVKRVIEKQSPVDEVLLVLDATTGQNGLVQARVFAEVVDVTGVVLTKLDGTARGGIVVAVQRELGVPVKLVGLGEGPDDLAPFDAVEFVEAIIHG
ncbi:MAG: signal recognition particle-docking protein FtsY [Candidatus Nanopelagicales bacterium]|nr:signal recognition particle-docking protein FtsY [Candidatus Nanopelagicales bacterium]